MNGVDRPRLEMLAAMLGAPARHVLVAAARLAREGASDDPLRRRGVVAYARAAPAAAEGVAALLATPIASFAQDETDRALTTLWPPRSVTGA